MLSTSIPNARSFLSPRRFLAMLLLSLVSITARADVMVLVHGWYADADTWLEHGVVQALAASGWRDGGVVVGGVRPAMPGLAAERKLYRAQLPASAPLEVQAGLLADATRSLQALYPNERLWLVGHSAGGVVARLMLVGRGAPSVSGLVTLASPNLGTPRAIEGLDVVESKPFFCPGPGIDFLKSLVGGADYDYLKFSRPAIAGLTPAFPGTLLDWLNRAPHPAIRYVSVIHGQDDLVPPASQDLNLVPPLRGRTETYLLQAPHSLSPGDGALIAQLLGGY